VIRLFVALPIPEPIARRLILVQAGIPGARWIEARNLHVTLRFIGEVEEHVAAEIDEALAAIRAPAFDLTVNGFGTFGSKNPHALWAGVEKVPELVHLQAKADSAVNRCGVDPEPRKFTPHITLARLKGAPVARLQAFIAGSSPFQAGPERVDHFILYRSHLGRSGAEYEALAEYPLG
jgi:2'-5' RNA ligase